MTKQKTTSSEGSNLKKQKMEDLLDQLKNQKFPKVGELIESTVINVGKK